MVQSFNFIPSASKRLWNTLNTWLKLDQIEGIFLRINYAVRERRYWKYHQFHGYKFLRLVCTAKDKNKMKTFEVYFVLAMTIISLWYGLTFIVNQKWKNKTYKLGKGRDRIHILQLARSRKETEIWIEKDGFKPSSTFDWKIVKTF